MPFSLTLKEEPDSKIVIEVDGVWHFIQVADGSVRYDGASQWKHRRITAAGWEIVSIPTKEYEISRNRADALKRYLEPFAHKISFKGGKLQTSNPSPRLSEPGTGRKMSGMM